MRSGSAWAGVAMVACLAGCGPTERGAGDARAEADALETQTQDEPKLALQTAVQADPALVEAVGIGVSQLPRGLDPLDDLEPWALRVADDLVFEGLVQRNGERYPWVEPGIADRCEVDREYAVSTIYCHLPRGVRFHDGAELEVEDVVYSLEYWLDPRREWIRERHGLGNLDKVQIVDGPRGAEDRDPGRWIQISLTKREPLALEALAAVKIVPRALHRGRESHFGEEPVGTGPMRVTTFERDRMVLERFDDYRDPEGHAAASKIVLRAYADGARGLTALRRGEIHVLAEVAPVHVPVELGKPGMSGRFVAYLLSPPRYDLLLWRLGRRDDLGLRAALHGAVPHAAISREVYGSPSLALAAPLDLHAPVALDLDALEDIKVGEAVRGGLLRLPPLADDGLGISAAAAALDLLGWVSQDGVRRKAEASLRMTLTWDGRSGRPTAIAERIAAAWESLGVAVPEATASWNYLLTLLRKGEFTVALVHLGGHSDEDHYQLFHSRGDSNFAGVDDAELDRALSDYRGASDRAGRDRAKQSIAARLAQLRVVTMIHAPTAVLLASRRVEGLAFVDDVPRLDRLTLEAGDIDWGAAGSY